MSAEIYCISTYGGISLSFPTKHVLVSLSQTSEERTKRTLSLLCLSHFLFIIKVSQRTLALCCPISIFTHKERLFMLCSVWRNHCISSHKWCLPVPTELDCSLIQNVICWLLSTVSQHHSILRPIYDFLLCMQGPKSKQITQTD